MRWNITNSKYYKYSLYPNNTFPFQIWLIMKYNYLSSSWICSLSEMTTPLTQTEGEGITMVCQSKIIRNYLQMFNNNNRWDKTKYGKLLITK